MPRSVSPLISLLALLVATSASASLSVRTVSCETKQEGHQTCNVSLEGVVGERDALYIPEIADIDRAYVGDRELGATGYAFGRQFYARFYPRIYSLGNFTGIKDPVVRVESAGIQGDALGIRPGEPITIIDVGRSLPLVLGHLFRQLAIALGLSGLVTLGILATRLRKDTRVLDGALYLGYLLATVLISLSMSKLPRVLMPSILSPRQYYSLHVLSHSFALLFLSLMLTRQSYEEMRAHSIDSRARFWRNRCSSLAAMTFAFQCWLLAFEPSWPIKLIHETGTGLQILVLAFIALRATCGKERLGSWKNNLWSERIDHVIVAVSALIMAYDGTYYIFRHTVDTKYYFFYCFIAIVLSDFGRVYERLSIERDSTAIALKVRTSLQSIKSGKEMLQQICAVLLDYADASRASIIAVKDGMALVLVSGGESALSEKSEPKPVGNILRTVVQTKRPVLVANKRQFESEFNTQGLLNSTLMVPIIQSGQVIAVISMMGKPGAQVSPRLFRVLEMATQFLSLEALSAINKTITEEQIEQLTLMTASTSGIVLEYVDPWGRLKKNITPTRRVIISIDGIRSTYIEQIAHGSPMIWELYRAFKQEVYSHWMALKEAFELVSKDVRGDDFWVLTPIAFRDPYLQELGAPKVALVAAVLMEECAREICLKPEYQILQRSGFHASVSSDVIEVLPLGTESSVCRDVHAKNMSKLSRIRSEAVPGSVLVDVGDEALERAASDIDLFVTKRADNVVAKLGALKDLHSLPKLVNIVGINATSQILLLKDKAREQAEASPYRSDAA